jgi:hypothetical protein
MHSREARSTIRTPLSSSHFRAPAKLTDSPATTVPIRKPSLPVEERRTDGDTSLGETLPRLFDRDAEHGLIIHDRILG